MNDSIVQLAADSNKLIMQMRDSQTEPVTVRQYLDSQTKEELIQLMASALVILDKLAKRYS